MGTRVWMHDVSESALQRCRDEQAAMLDEQIEAGVVSADQRQAILNRIQFTGSLSEAAGAADLVIEAAREDLDVKRELFRALDEICPPHTILATNSSSLRSVAHRIGDESAGQGVEHSLHSSGLEASVRRIDAGYGDIG